MITADKSASFLEKSEFPYYEFIDEHIERTDVNNDESLQVTTSQQSEPPPILILMDKNGNPLREMSFDDYSFITAVEFSPDSRLIAVGLIEGKLILIDVEKWEILKTIEAHQGSIVSLSFSNDGQYLVSIGSDGMLFCWGGD